MTPASPPPIPPKGQFGARARWRAQHGDEAFRAAVAAEEANAPLPPKPHWQARVEWRQRHGEQAYQAARAAEK